MGNSRVHLGVERNGTDWRERAVCRSSNGHDPELWFAPPPHPYGTHQQQREARKRRMAMEAEAKRLCATCPVILECLSYAMDNDEREGIWAGLTPQERGKQPLR